MIYDPDVTEYFNESQTSGNLEGKTPDYFQERISTIKT